LAGHETASGGRGSGCWFGGRVGDVGDEHAAVTINSPNERMRALFRTVVGDVIDTKIKF
jgi:hypothetical protein